MKKTIKFLVGGLLLFWFAYLLLPESPAIPQLPGSLKSIEPGDTTQIPGVTAYYTNLSRQEVISFYQNNYSHSSLLNIPFITYRLNHPPEMVREILRATQQSSYIEEIVHPLRESLYVNGYEWENDPFLKPDKRFVNKMVIDNKEFKAKITIFQRNSNPLLRVIISFGFLVFVYWLLKETKGIIKEIIKK